MIHRGPRSLGDERLRLREVTRADAAELHRWRQEPTARQMVGHAGEVPLETHLAFVERYFAADNDDRWFVIEADGEPVGAIALYGLTADGSEAEWGRFVVDPRHRGRGWGRRALDLLVAHARELGLRRLSCEVLVPNPRAESLYRSVGFRPAGERADGGRRFLRLALDLDDAAGSAGASRLEAAP